ncbi:CLUMA_CG008333, isoform A [Clunio marinus]|uniref:CLUMA_CG008333, isoform A n=1 Tax=Clunio marinus TaxID=568069 RepID=A0A1J1I8U1_9DIPT|nr:CLUMA_CG008333, isoform A [Clunio marinus]
MLRRLKVIRVDFEYLVKAKSCEKYKIYHSTFFIIKFSSTGFSFVVLTLFLPFHLAKKALFVDLNPFQRGKKPTEQKYQTHCSLLNEQRKSESVKMKTCDFEFPQMEISRL